MTKKRFRKYCKDNLKTVSASSNLYKLNHMVLLKLDNVLNDLNPQSILIYSALKIEPNLTKTIKKLRIKKSVYFPFMVDKSLKMVKYRLPLIKKSFGVKEPKNSHQKIKKVDLAIVPVIGVDGGFKRVGFGKGFYDRFFSTLKVRPIIVFVQIKECINKSFICDSYDVEGDFLITPKKIYYNKGRVCLKQ